MLKKLRNVDRRIIYLILIIALGIPIIKPLGMPFAICLNSRIFYDYVNRLNTGDVVVLSIDYDPQSKDEMNPGAVAVMRHIVEQKKGVKLIMLSFNSAGPLLIDSNMENLAKEGLGADWIYGEDWVNLGYIAGGENAISAFANDVTGAFKRDRRGNKTEDLPILEGVNNAGDIDLLINIGSLGTNISSFVRHAVDVYGTPFIANLFSVSVADTMPYVNSGQVSGYINGLLGAGEYEALYGCPGAGTSAMDSYSFGHLAIIFFVILGNITYYADPENRKKLKK